MKQFAIAMVAYNPRLKVNQDAGLLTIIPSELKNPLGCQVSIFLAPTLAEAERLAREHCHNLFPAQRGWEQHGIKVCDIARTLLTTEI